MEAAGDAQEHLHRFGGLREPGVHATNRGEVGGVVVGYCTNSAGTSLSVMGLGRSRGARGAIKSLIPLRRLVSFRRSREFPDGYSGGENSTCSNPAGLILIYERKKRAIITVARPTYRPSDDLDYKRPQPMAVEPLTWTLVAQATQA